MIPQVQVGARPPWGAWLRMSTRQHAAHTCMHVHITQRDTQRTDTFGTSVHKRGQDKVVAGAPQGSPEGHAGLQSLPTPALLLGTRAVLPPQDPWLCTQSQYGSLASLSPAHSWATAHSVTLGRGILFTTALLPESRVSCVSAPPASGPGDCSTSSTNGWLIQSWWN